MVVDLVTIIRKRLIPMEEIDISSDEVLYYDEKVLITRWIPIKPRNDVGWGLSYTCFYSNYKISAFYDKAGIFLYWYCDIISVEYFKNERKYIIKDLLIDLRIKPDCEPEVLDLDELEAAFQQKLITKEEKELALRTVESLLYMISSENFPPKAFDYIKYLPPKIFSKQGAE